ncbi:septal ring lytic transglycosylase RlpA family protein [Candidatus Obscuribacterales bacterium]|nr:septal ring lytic transglycosylase RlpA family protein [Candidatus Obscuribacterales bacterium]
MRKIIRLASNVVSTSALAFLFTCATANSAHAKVAVTAGHTFSGYSHHYGDHLHGRRTSSGQPHNKFKLTCAHRTLPFGTHLHVTNTKNGKSCVVVVNDRGPFGNPSLVLDVSKAAAHALGFPGGGKIPISARVLDKQEGAEGLKQSHQCHAVRNYITQNADAATIAALPPKTVPAALLPVKIEPASETVKTVTAVVKPPISKTEEKPAAVATISPKTAVDATRAIASTGLKPAAEATKAIASTGSKPAAEATKAIATIGSKPAAEATKAIASLPANSVANRVPHKAVEQPEAPETTFLLVINDALENDKSVQHTAKTAEYSTTARHANYAPTVFMPMTEQTNLEVPAQKKPSTARAIPEGQTLM